MSLQENKIIPCIGTIDLDVNLQNNKVSVKNETIVLSNVIITPIIFLVHKKMENNAIVQNYHVDVRNETINSIVEIPKFRIELKEKTIN